VIRPEFPRQRPHLITCLLRQLPWESASFLEDGEERRTALLAEFDAYPVRGRRVSARVAGCGPAGPVPCGPGGGHGTGFRDGRAQTSGRACFSGSDIRIVDGWLVDSVQGAVHDTGVVAVAKSQVVS
jgi:hypothetical protein